MFVCFWFYLPLQFANVYLRKNLLNRIVRNSNYSIKMLIFCSIGLWLVLDVLLSFELENIREKLLNGLLMPNDITQHYEYGINIAFDIISPLIANIKKKSQHFFFSYFRFLYSLFFSLFSPPRIFYAKHNHTSTNATTNEKCAFYIDEADCYFCYLVPFIYHLAFYMGVAGWMFFGILDAGPKKRCLSRGLLDGIRFLWVVRCVWPMSYIYQIIYASIQIFESNDTLSFPQSTNQQALFINLLIFMLISSVRACVLH